jgi:transcription antitermination factor NusG
MQTDSPWRVLQVRAQHEQAIAAMLEERDIEHFLPTYTERRAWSHRAPEDVTRPLFPTYLFGRFPYERRLEVLSTPGVISVVAFAGVPAEVTDAEVERIRRMATCGLPVEPLPWLNVGDRVQITTGPLRGIQGILLTGGTAPKLVVGIDMMTRSIGVKLDRQSFRAIQPVRIPIH